MTTSSNYYRVFVMCNLSFITYNESIGKTKNDDIVIVISGASAYIKELALQNRKVEIKMVEEYT